MKKLLLYGIICLGYAACQSVAIEPPPPLSYTGEDPKIQIPLSPEDSQKHIQLPKGFTAELFAAEPDIINPIQFAWDERGRLWVVQSQDYPHELENEVGGDRITICEDTNGDGKADTFTDFATEQSLSTGIVVVKGGAIVAQAPDMVFLEDTDGDDKMDKRTVLFSGFGIWDTHAGPSSLRYGIDNHIWGAVGYSGFESNFNGKDVSFTRGVYRFTRDGKSFEPIGQFNNNTWGMGMMPDGEIFGSTANNNHACYIGIPLRYYNYMSKLPSWAMNADFIQGHYEIAPVDTVPLQQVDVRGGYTAAAGANFYTANNYPKTYQNQMYVNAPTGHLVHIARIEKDGAGFKEVDGGNIFASTDAWTAPVFTETGPDGNLWVADWYNPVLQHNPDSRGMPNQIWNDNKGEGNAHLNEHRDKRHGRIYVVKYKGKVDKSIQSLDPSDLKTLIKALDNDNMFWRTTAQRLIVEHFSVNQLGSSLQQLQKMATKNIHALWILDAFDQTDDIDFSNLLTAVDPTLLKAALALLPLFEESSEALVTSDLLNNNNLHIRRHAILKASELPETDKLFQAMEQVSRDETNTNDKWLNSAIKMYFKEKNLEDIEEEDVDMIMPAGGAKSNSWKYTTDAPGNDWTKESFDDSKWALGESVFGTWETLNGLIRTKWETDHIWMRKTVDLSEDIPEPVIKYVNDEDFDVYVNGEPLFKKGGWRTDYKLVRLDKNKASLFKKGKNVIAVHCVNTGGNQHIDIGLGNVAQFKADRTFYLTAVPTQMAYDKKVLHAMAGEKIEIVLENTDEMQHNLVLIQKGSTEVFGKVVDQFLKSPDAAKMEYVPQSRYVLGATEMLDPEEIGTIQLTLPDKPGSYPYICTFPGHWRMMQGVIEVSPKGSYISSNPDAPKIAVMGGGGSHDFEKYFGIADGKIFHQNGKQTVNYTESSAELTDLLADADMLVISNNKGFDPKTKETIFSRVNNGMPMMICHPSTWYNWKDWPEYNKQLVAGGSESHEKLQEFEVIVKKPNHPIMKGVPNRFRIVDELYRWKHDLTGPKIDVLAVGRGLESGEEFPVVYTVKHPHTKIVGNTLGHDSRAHSLKAYQTILENSFEWLK
jgi:putative membrane-bound dehydrogenase-like protein